MLYQISLQTAGVAVGIFLLLISLAGLTKPAILQTWAKRLPRSRAAGVVLLSVAFAWSMWLLATMEMGEFSNFRRPLLIVVPIGFLLVLRFVDEFLAVRSLGILCLLAAEPLIDAAFLRYEPSRLIVTVFAYLLVIAGLFWVTMPYLLRDQIDWSAHSNMRWHFLHGIALIYGAVTLGLALTLF
ncbi:MAG: hypothetical protein QOI34_336 [Verrucomicrobiota bacterium]|jgi:hypothetical protein